MDKKLVQELKQEKLIRLARKDPNVFIEAVLRDARDNTRLKQADIHLSWEDHISACWSKGMYAGILAPWGHGKSVNMLGRILFELGQSETLRIKIVSNSDDTAKERVSTLKRYIEESSEFQKIFPNIKPDQNQWGSQRFTIERPVASPDPTLTSHGVLSTGIGGRADLVAFDDISDFRNAIAEPKKQIQVINNVYNTWLSRLEPHGRALMIATRWSMQDAVSELLKSTAWVWLIQKISKDLTYIEEEVQCAGNVTSRRKLPLWSRWDTESLQKKRRSMTQQAFERGFRQRPFSDEDRLFSPASIITAIDWLLSMEEVKEMQGKCYTGVDISGPSRPGVAFFTIKAVKEGNKIIRTPVDIRLGTFVGQAFIDQFIEIEKEFHPEVFMVENNACQGRIIDMLNITEAGNLPIVPFYTGQNKVKEDVGLPSVSVEFENKLWKLPWKGMERGKMPPDGHGPLCKCAGCTFYDELMGYPMSDSSDLLMAAWLAREGLRQYGMFGEIFEYFEPPVVRGQFRL